MARIIYCHPNLTQYDYHIFTDLDFWDARKILKDLALVKRNYSRDPPGDEFPTQVVGVDLAHSTRQAIEKRLRRAIVSPPRHIIVESVIKWGFFEFDPRQYYPAHWDKARMLHFTWRRLPLNQSALNSPYKEVVLSWNRDKIRVQTRQREEKWDPAVQDKREAHRRRRGPGCF